MPAKPGCFAMFIRLFVLITADALDCRRRVLVVMDIDTFGLIDDFCNASTTLRPSGMQGFSRLQHVFIWSEGCNHTLLCATVTATSCNSLEMRGIRAPIVFY